MACVVTDGPILLPLPMLPDLSRLALRGAPTDGIVVLEEDDRRRFDDDAKENPRLDSLDLEPIPANVPLFEMPVDPEKPDGVMDYFNPATVWRAALANPMKAPLRPLLREEWEELKGMYGDATAASDEGKKKMQKAERCLERYWRSEPGEDIVCGSEDGSGSEGDEDDEDVPSDPVGRFAYLLAAGDPAVVAAGSLEKLNEWLQLVATPDVPEAVRPRFEERIMRRIENDARERGTLPDAWPHPAMLREIRDAMLFILESLLPARRARRGGEGRRRRTNRTTPATPMSGTTRGGRRQLSCGATAGGILHVRLLPGLPESSVNDTSSAPSSAPSSKRKIEDVRLHPRHVR